MFLLCFYTNPALDCFVANAPRNDGTLSLRAMLSLRAKHIGPRVRWISALCHCERSISDHVSDESPH